MIHVMKIGYARVLTDGQGLALQIDALQDAGCTRLCKDKKSGAHTDRPELKRMPDQLRKGDTVIVWRLERLARSTRDLLDLAETIDDCGAGLKSLGEPWTNTTTPLRKMVMTVFGGTAEFERALIRDRAGAGRIAAQEAWRPLRTTAKTRSGTNCIGPAPCRRRPARPANRKHLRCS